MELTNMELLDSKGAKVNVNFSANGEFNKPIWAKNGGGQSFVTTSTDELKNLPKEVGKAILGNSNHKLVMKVSPEE